ncbi:MAG: hypothetical protein WAN65_16075 [Candidatus Sulfotelmatobacter sp.]
MKCECVTLTHRFVHSPTNCAEPPTLKVELVFKWPVVEGQVSPPDAKVIRLRRRREVQKHICGRCYGHMRKLIREIDGLTEINVLLSGEAYRNQPKPAPTTLFEETEGAK